MEKKICKKCGKEFPGGSKYKLCEECIEKRKSTIKKIGLVVGAGAVSVAATALVTTLLKGNENSEDYGFDNMGDIDTKLGIPKYEFEKLQNAIDDGKISISWANYNKDNLQNGTLTVNEVINFGSGSDDDD